VTDNIRAIVARDIDGRTRGTLEEIDALSLPAGDVTVDVSCSTLNYKDGLAITGKGKICRSLPMVCGIDLAGTVRESRSPEWQAGDRVLVNGFGLSERYWGGLAQRASLQAGWLVRIPAAFSAEQVMALGTAGYTAMLCVQAITDHGVRPDAGPVLVTGAAGGVGSVAVMLLSALGYKVTALTGRVEETGEFLRGLGASELLAREHLARLALQLVAAEGFKAGLHLGGHRLDAPHCGFQHQIRGGGGKAHAAAGECEARCLTEGGGGAMHLGIGAG
jgi:acrylyl-CoA reductase (NADPH)